MNRKAKTDVFRFTLVAWKYLFFRLNDRCQLQMDTSKLSVTKTMFITGRSDRETHVVCRHVRGKADWSAPSGHLHCQHLSWAKGKRLVLCSLKIPLFKRGGQWSHWPTIQNVEAVQSCNMITWAYFTNHWNGRGCKVFRVPILPALGDAVFDGLVDQMLVGGHLGSSQDEGGVGGGILGLVLFNGCSEKWERDKLRTAHNTRCS